MLTRKRSADNLIEADWHRRGSYHAAGGNGPSRPPSIYSTAGNGGRHYQDGYYASRRSSHVDPRSRDSYYESSQNGGGGYGDYNVGNGYSSVPRHHGSRPHLNVQYNQQRLEPLNSIYPNQHKDRSYETVTSAGASGSLGDHGSYHTDPSSDNSSFNRASPPKPSPPLNDYGIAFSGPTTYQPSGLSIDANATETQMHKGIGGSAAPVPAANHGAAEPTAVPTKSPVDKRKSWLSRRFSRKS
jgi:hypothetical protein